MFYLVTINGLIDSLNPCAVGVAIFYIALLLTLKESRKLLFIFGLFYIFSIFTTYFLIGLGILKAFHLFGIHNFFGWLASFLILGLGLYNLKEYFLPRLYIPYLSPFLSRCRMIKINPQISLLSAILLGFLVGICEFPCSGGIYLATVSLLSLKETFLKGILYLLLYNLMFILPLIVIFLGANNRYFFSWFKRNQAKHAPLVKLIMGVSMIISSILLIIWLAE